jgi:hypothetical protein
MILKRQPKPTTVLLYIFFAGKGIQHGLCDGPQPGEGPGVGTWYRQAGVAAANFFPLRTLFMCADKNISKESIQYR